MALRHRALGSWRTSGIGIALGIYDLIQGIPDVTALTWKELLIRLTKAAAIASLGLLAHDKLSGCDHDKQA